MFSTGKISWQKIVAKIVKKSDGKKMLAKCGGKKIWQNLWRNLVAKKFVAKFRGKKILAKFVKKSGGKKICG
jgi:hypothetical protein